jgi:hypothetical protein
MHPRVIELKVRKDFQNTVAAQKWMFAAHERLPSIIGVSFRAQCGAPFLNLNPINDKRLPRARWAWYKRRTRTRR